MGFYLSGAANQAIGCKSKIIKIKSFSGENMKSVFHEAKISMIDANEMQYFAQK